MCWLRGTFFFCPVMCHVCPVEPCTECKREMPSGQEMCTDSKQMTSPPVYVHRILMHTWCAAKVLHKQGRHETEANIFSFNKGEYVEEERPSLVTLSAFPKIDRDDVRRVPLCVFSLFFSFHCHLSQRLPLLQVEINQVLQPWSTWVF